MFGGCELLLWESMCPGAVFEGEDYVCGEPVDQAFGGGRVGRGVGEGLWMIDLAAPASASTSVRALTAESGTPAGLPRCGDGDAHALDRLIECSQRSRRVVAIFEVAPHRAEGDEIRLPGWWRERKCWGLLVLGVGFILFTSMLLFILIRWLPPRKGVGDDVFKIFILGRLEAGFQSS